MKTFARRGLFGASVFSAGVGTAALVTMLAVSPSCSGTPASGSSDSDGGVARDLAGTSPDMPVGGFALTSVFPASGLSAGGNTVTIVGTGFAAGASVTFGTTAATNVQVLSLTQISAVVPSSAGVVGPVTVTVKNADGSTVTRGDVYSYYRIQVAFQPVITATVGTNPAALIATDLNGDGFTEIVTANQSSNNVTVLAYTQSWKNGVAYPASTSPTSLVAADFNSNGRPDVAVTCSNATGNDLAVLPDNGGTGFQAPVNLKVAMNLVGVDARDLNGDGKADLVAVARSTGLAYVLLNTSTGMTTAFTAGSNFMLGNQPSGVVLGDVDGDGKVDIVASNFGSSTVSVLLGLGSANFAAARYTTTATQPIALALGDVNKDGKVDVVTASYNTKQVSVLLARGDGSFPTLRNLPAGEKPMSIATGDLDGDGNRDVVFANSGADNITVLLGRADGTFEPGQTFTVGSQPFGVLVADLNKDGKLDIATANYNSSDVSILYNKIQ